LELALPVHARYLAKTIDVDLFHEKTVPAGMQRQVLGRDSVMLSLRDRATVLSDSFSEQQGHVVVFSYGAVVFFNVTSDLRSSCIDSFNIFCFEAIPDGFQPIEDYSINFVPQSNSDNVIPQIRRAASWPSLGRRPAGVLQQHQGRLEVVVRHRTPCSSGQRSSVSFDYAAIPQLDVHNLAAIATVLAQSVALDHYSVKVDAMLETFSRLNSSVERTGVFSALEKKSLFRLVALNNTVFTDVIAKIGVLERSDTAWKYLQYADIWDGLREEFEIDDRFRKIEFKLNLIQQNSKFFLEVLATDKSNTLEWIIIVLISVEIAVMAVEIACGI